MNKEDNKTIEKVLEKIQGVKPKPKWYFVIKGYSLWVLVFTTTFVGSISVSSIIFRLVNINKIGYMQPPFPGQAPLPLFWISLTIILAYLLYKEIRLTKSGYKYEMYTIGLTIFSASAILGIFFFILGSGYVADRLVARHFSLNQNIESLRQQMWLRPDGGFLIGKVLEKYESSFILQDPTMKEWTVYLDEKISSTEKSLVKVDETLGIRGSANQAEKVFYACEVKDLTLRGKGFFKEKAQEGSGRLQNERKLEFMRNTICEGTPS